VDFHDFAEEEIEQIRRVLHSSAGDSCIALGEVENEPLFEPSSDSDDEDWDANDSFNIPGSKILTRPLSEAVPQFHIYAVSEDVQNSFIGLYHSEEFQAATNQMK
jgi:hypothetical protein